MFEVEGSEVLDLRFVKLVKAFYLIHLISELQDGKVVLFLQSNDTEFFSFFYIYIILLEAEHENHGAYFPNTFCSPCQAGVIY